MFARSAVWSVCLLAGCIFRNDPSASPVDAGDSDLEGNGKDAGTAGTECLPDATFDDARGILAVVNDPAVTADTLDVLLPSDTGAAIIAARPFADLVALDAVNGVGSAACTTLRDYACSKRGLCEPELSLWTWNVEHFPLSPSAVGEVANALITNGAELVGFEEVDSLPAFDQLIAKLPGWVGIPGTYRNGTQVALGYRAGRLTVAATEHLFTGPDDGYAFPRPPLAVTFDIAGRAGQGQLIVLVVHLKAYIDAESQERRRQAVIALDQWIGERTAAGHRVFAVGDWNDEIDVAPPDNVFQPVLDKPNTYDAWTVDVAKRGGYSYLGFGGRLLDHIVATDPTGQMPAFPLLEIDPIELDKVIADYRNTVSDHRPVRARIVPVLPP